MLYTNREMTETQAKRAIRNLIAASDDKELVRGARRALVSLDELVLHLRGQLVSTWGLVPIDQGGWDAASRLHEIIFAGLSRKEIAAHPRRGPK